MKAKAAKKERPGIRKVSEAFQLYDKSTFIPTKIRAGLKLLGEDGYLPDDEFRRLCEVDSEKDFSRFRSEFEAHFVEVPRRTMGSRRLRLWFGSPKQARHFRERQAKLREIAT
jgi:hypothetical protein